MTFTQYAPQPKIEGKFYPLQTEEHMKASRELTKAQMIVFYYFKTIDPFGEKWININITELAEQLGLSRITVSRALKVLDNLGWLEFELTSIQGRVRSERSNECAEPIANDCDALANDCKRSQMIALGNLTSQTIANDRVRSQMIGLDHSRSEEIANDQVKVLESAPNKGFTPSKTNKTIYTLQTLSTNENEKPKTEREIGKKDKDKFRKFAAGKMEQLPKYPVLPKKWIDKNFTELWAEYEELEGRRKEMEERIRESTEKPQDTVLDPIIAAGLASGEILEIDPTYKMLRDADGHWHHQHEWIERKNIMLAES
ncbi:helix-turn-helix domain-containing protein [Aliterella atlantica]|uniref:helix-turn-helix domain-containing protein n=1 Tax=Aliterella atlantica TaxID=1827278 RepID=UPI000698035D|nr:HTH domain-containing protein [Aliterella atlantica]